MSVWNQWEKLRMGLDQTVWWMWNFIAKDFYEFYIWNDWNHKRQLPCEQNRFIKMLAAGEYYSLSRNTYKSDCVASCMSFGFENKIHYVSYKMPPIGFGAQLELEISYNWISVFAIDRNIQHLSILPLCEITCTFGFASPVL